MKLRFGPPTVLAKCLLLSVLCVAQSPDQVNKTRLDALLVRAGHGDAESQIKLANAYLGRASQTGVTVQPDISEALRWYLMAAKQNSIKALLELGSGYQYGYFGKPDGEKAVEYYRRAAELGSHVATAYLTGIYSSGAKGLARDFDEAARWANCPKPSTAAMEDYLSDTSHGDQLPDSAKGLLRKLKCEDAMSVYDITKIPLRDGSGSPNYEVCCSYLPHGPCNAVIIGEVGGKWRNLTDQFGLNGSIMITEGKHAGLHDLCLPHQSFVEISNDNCPPTILEFNGIRYHPVSGCDVVRPK